MNDERIVNLRYNMIVELLRKDMSAKKAIQETEEVIQYILNGKTKDKEGVHANS